MNYILIFLIFSGVISAGNALCCNTCEVLGEGENNCVGNREECKETDFCISQIERNTLRENTKNTLRKRCMGAKDRKLCNQLLKLNTGEFTYLLYSECCNNSDGCNSKEIKMPEENKTLNEFHCETCYVENSYNCTDSTWQNCTGNQEQCFSLEGYAARPEEDFKKYAFKGCVTKYACCFNIFDLPGTKLKKDANYVCTDPLK